MRARGFTDLLGLRSRHGNDAPDPLSNGLLGDNDKRPDVNRVLQMAAGEHGATAHFAGSFAHRDVLETSPQPLSIITMFGGGKKKKSKAASWPGSDLKWLLATAANSCEPASGHSNLSWSS